MLKALVITIGTEITCGEVVNTNASWVSRQIEDLGARVFSHLSVRDHAGETASALAWSKNYDYVIVTGGLGPTSDDMTRAALAEFTGQPLEFDSQVWSDLTQLYQERQLTLREAHRQQCYFPRGCERLRNPVGTALGFAQIFEGRHYFVLPGPPRELAGMWEAEVAPRLRALLPQAKSQWRRWICLGAPESEIAELVEREIQGLNIEVGYRAQVPYVKVKVFVDPAVHGDLLKKLDAAMAPYVVGRGEEDLAEELLKLWPKDDLWLVDEVTGSVLTERLLAAWKSLKQKGQRGAFPIFSRERGDQDGLFLQSDPQQALISEIRQAGVSKSETRILPYKLKLDSERGRISSAEWALWFAVRALRAQPWTSST